MQQQPVLQELHDLGVEDDPSGRGHRIDVAERIQQDVEPLHVVERTEVGEARLAGRLLVQLPRVERAVVGHRPHAVEHLDDVRAKTGRARSSMWMASVTVPPSRCSRSPVTIHWVTE